MVSHKQEAQYSQLMLPAVQLLTVLAEPLTQLQQLPHSTTSSDQLEHHVRKQATQASGVAKQVLDKWKNKGVPKDAGLLLALPALSAAAGHSPFMDEGLQRAMERMLVDLSQEERVSLSGVLNKVRWRCCRLFVCLCICLKAVRCSLPPCIREERKRLHRANVLQARTDRLLMQWSV